MKTINKTVWVFLYKNKIAFETFSYTRKEAIRKFLYANEKRFGNWAKHYNQGYRCRKAKLIINTE